MGPPEPVRGYFVRSHGHRCLSSLFCALPAAPTALPSALTREHESVGWCCLGKNRGAPRPEWAALSSVLCREHQLVPGAWRRSPLNELSLEAQG